MSKGRRWAFDRAPVGFEGALGVETAILSRWGWFRVGDGGFELVLVVVLEWQ